MLRCAVAAYSSSSSRHVNRPPSASPRAMQIALYPVNVPTSSALLRADQAHDQLHQRSLVRGYLHDRAAASPPSRPVRGRAPRPSARPTGSGTRAASSVASIPPRGIARIVPALRQQATTTLKGRKSRRCPAESNVSTATSFAAFERDDDVAKPGVTVPACLRASVAVERNRRAECEVDEALVRQYTPNPVALPAVGSPAECRAPETRERARLAGLEDRVCRQAAYFVASSRSRVSMVRS